MIFTLYKVIFKGVKTETGDIEKVAHDITPIRIIDHSGLYNLKDYKLKDIADLLSTNYSFLSRHIIDSKKHDIDDVLKDINKYLINNQYIIIKDYL